MTCSQLLQGDRYTPRRIRVRNAEGEWRWLGIIAADLLDDPDVGSIVVHAWDITDEVARGEEIDASRRLLASLIDTLDEGVGVVSDGTLAFGNANVSQFFPGRKLGPAASTSRPSATSATPRRRPPPFGNLTAPDRRLRAPIIRTSTHPYRRRA
jgi:hypothetical protein